MFIARTTNKAFSPILKNKQCLFANFSGMPSIKPDSPNFGSGPCKKRPGWTPDALSGGALGRSHRSALGKAKLKEAIDLSKEVLGLPEGYHLGIVPASDTGAYEMAMWSLLGERPVDMCYWESFGKGWMTDATAQLPLEATRGGPGLNHHKAEYGELPDLSKTSGSNDICFTWNGTTSGVRVPNGDWIPDNREGLTLCDATSACFAMDMPWEKLDVVTYSWQKVLGGEGAHGILILSPRAVERLESYTPAWPLPKIFRMVKKGAFDSSIFVGSTINTPSMLAVEDYIDALNWSKSIGGLNGLMDRSNANLNVMKKYVSENDFIDFLATDESTISNTSICLSLNGVDGDQIKSMTKLLEENDVAYDIGAYRDAPPGLRIWGGATVEPSDMEKLMPWLTWAYNEVK
jgi:phosphoserine aminotransferase